MVSRRTVLGGTALGSALAAFTPEPALAAGAADAVQASSDRAIEEVAKAIMALQNEVRRTDSFWEITLVREPIKTFLRLSGKFPDYIEVGTDIWQQVYDWHVRYRQPLNLAKDGQGRYTILLMSTLVIMRPELSANYVGQPYDMR